MCACSRRLEKLHGKQQWHKRRKGWAEVKEERHKGSGCPLRLIWNSSFKCVAAHRPGMSGVLPVALHSVRLEMQDTAYPGSFRSDPTLLTGPVYLPV